MEAAGIEQALGIMQGCDGQGVADQDASPAPARRTRVRKPRAEETKPALVLLERPDTAIGSDLVEDTAAYTAWLRVVMLRVILRTPALGHLKQRFDFNLHQICAFLGFGNFEEFVAERTLAEIEAELSPLLARWESESGPHCRFPGHLAHNLQAIAGIVGLAPLEREILGFGVLLHTEHLLEVCCNLIGTNLPGHSIERLLAPILGREVEQIRQCLQRGALLATSGLLNIDLSGYYSLRQLIDLLTRGFAPRMVQAQADVRRIVEGFVRTAPAPGLAVEDYGHVAVYLQTCLDLLRHATQQQAKGINILIYGPPGSGKTEFARLLASRLQLQLMEICAVNAAGAPVAPIRRVRNYRVAQAFFRRQPTLLLFDECEEILETVTRTDHSDNEATVPRKSWINQMLEGNAVPTLWIGNGVEDFDPAYVRRFSLCLEMPLPTQGQREALMARTFGKALGGTARAALARHPDATPGVVAQAASVVQAIAADRAPGERDALALRLVSGTMRAQGKRGVDVPGEPGVGGAGFRPQWTRCGVDLSSVRDSLARSRSGRLCLYGPPGTGKTAMGQWLSRELDIPLLALKASDLLSPYLGETEQRLARAFDQAREQGALLQLDEVDSFLQDRRKASRPWEVTQVNEMLTQMESFQGIFIATTNLFGNLDEASLRRFDLAIKFDFLAPEAAWDLFASTCERLGVTGLAAADAARLGQLRQLTPGDFEQVVRGARLLPPQTAGQVLQQLEAAVALKPQAGGRPVGFLAPV